MPENKEFDLKPTSGTVTVAISAQLSDAFELYGTTLVAFETPAAITGVAYTFHGSLDKGATYKEIRDSSGAAISFTAAVDGSYPVDPAQFVAYDSIKINTGTNEVAERTIKVKAYPV